MPVKKLRRDPAAPTGITAPNFYSIGSNVSAQVPTSGAGRRRTISMSVDTSRSRYPASSQNSTLLGPPDPIPPASTYERRPSLFSSGYKSPVYSPLNSSGVSSSSASSSSIGTPSPILSNNKPPSSNAGFYFSSSRMDMQGFGQALQEDDGEVGNFECKTCNKAFPKECVHLFHLHERY